MVAELRFDARKHAYFLNEDGKERPLQGVTTKKTVISIPALVGWAARMACEHIEGNSELRKCEMCENDDHDYWHVHPKTLEEARTAHAKKRDSAADSGTDLHAMVESYVNLCIAEFDGKPIQPLVPLESKALQPFIEWAQKENIRFIASEQRLFSSELSIAGTCDVIAEKDGRRM